MSTSKSTLRKQWIAKLRELEMQFLQGHGALKRQQRDGHFYYCCLGVAKDFILPSTLEPQEGDGKLYGYKSKSSHGDLINHTGSLSRQDLELLELTAADQEHLIDMNDTRRMSFSEIANWLEHNKEDNSKTKRKYTLSQYQVAKQAAALLNIPDASTLIYLCNISCWNAVQEWAREITTKGAKE